MLAAKNAALRAACSIIISQYFHVLVHVSLNDGVLIIIFFFCYFFSLLLLLLLLCLVFSQDFLSLSGALSKFCFNIIVSDQNLSLFSFFLSLGFFFLYFYFYFYLCLIQADFILLISQKLGIFRVRLQILLMVFSALKCTTKWG